MFVWERREGIVLGRVLIALLRYPRPWEGQTGGERFANFPASVCLIKGGGRQVIRWRRGIFCLKSKEDQHMYLSSETIEITIYRPTTVAFNVF